MLAVARSLVAIAIEIAHRDRACVVPYRKALRALEGTITVT